MTVRKREALTREAEHRETLEILDPESLSDLPAMMVKLMAGHLLRTSPEMLRWAQEVEIVLDRLGLLMDRAEQAIEPPGLGSVQGHRALLLILDELARGPLGRLQALLARELGQ